MNFASESKGNTTMAATKAHAITYLLVEDNDELADIVQRCLRSLKSPGRVHRVKAGADCLAYLAAEKPFEDRNQYPYPDVVLLDIRMPGVLDGLQTLRAIRADPRHSSLTVMMLTSSDSDGDVRQAYQLGANGYIVKSASAGGLMEKIENLQQSLETVMRLPDQTDQCHRDASPNGETASGVPIEMQAVLDGNENAAFGLLVSAYREDRDDGLAFLNALAQASTTRFANLVSRFCVDKRSVFAGGEDADWIFIREVVMEQLPRHTSQKKMAGIVATISAALAENPAARKDQSSWQLWEGFSRAYLNQGMDASPEPDEVLEDVAPSLSRRRQLTAAGAVIVVLVFLAGVGAYELFTDLWMVNSP